MKKLLLGAVALSLGMIGSLHAQRTFVSHDFNNGQFFPYEVPKADQRARVTIVNNALQTRWDQSSYNGTNSGRKAQIKQFGEDHTDEILFTRDIWMGFKLKIHSDYMRENTNTNAGLMQIWGHHSGGSENHMVMLKFDGRNGGALVWQGRYNSNQNFTHFLVYPNFPRNRFVDIVMHVRLGERNAGQVKVWADGQLRLNKTGVTVGWGDQDSRGMINGTYAFGTSIGQYNYMENASRETAYDGTINFDGHRNGETRTVTYDDVALYSGADGYSRVAPDGGDNGGTTGSGDIVHMRKRNANGFAIDGNGGAANAQNIYIWAQNTGNVNQQWIEIDRGGGYYSYQKRGTNYCIDGGRGGANGQNVYLWACGTGNQNQHWRKANMGSGNYRLEKRNASGFSLDGGRGGANRQNLYLWANNNANQNQHWFFTNVGSAKSLVGPEPLSEFINVFPNPMVDTFSVDIAELETAKVSMFSTSGKLVFEETVEGGLNNFTLNDVAPGLYIVQIQAGTQLLTKKLLKK